MGEEEAEHRSGAAGTRRAAVLVLESQIRSLCMERDIELGLKEDTSTVEEDNETFFDCGENESVEQHSGDHPPQETDMVEDSQRDVVDGQECLLPCLTGHDLNNISQIFNAIAGTVGFGLLMAFMGLTFTPASSIFYRPLLSSCAAPADYVGQLYELVIVGLCVTIIEFIASLLGAGKKETEEAGAEPHVPVMRRVFIFIAAVSHVGLTICVLWSLILATSLRMGRISCWKHGFSGLIFTGFSVISSMSLYVAYVGFGCVFGTN